MENLPREEKDIESASETVSAFREQQAIAGNPEVGKRERLRSAFSGEIGFWMEAVLAAAATFSAVLGLFGIGRGYTMPGAAILLASGLLVASWARRFAAHARTRETGMAEVGALSAEYLMGGPAFILGTLAMVGIVPTVLTAVAVLLFGVGWMFGGTEVARQGNISMIYPSPHPPEQEVLRGLRIVTAIEMLAGIAAIILGILALVGKSPTVLLLIGLLALAATELMGAATVAWRMRRYR